MRGEDKQVENWKEFNRDVLQKVANSKSVNLRQYCDVSQKVLDAPADYLIDQMDRAYKQNRSSKNVFTYLTSANPDLTLNRKIITKKDQESKDAGKKVFDMIGYQWDYYIRMLKGMKDQPNSGLNNIYTPENIELAKNKIKEMIKEMKDMNYLWENMTKDLMADQETQRKQIKQEEVFIKLLTNMLNTQTKKLIRARNKDKNSIISQQSQFQRSNNPQESQQRQEPQVVEEIIQEKPKKNISELIDIGAYFALRKKRLQGQMTTSNPIEELEQRRKFNGAALRFGLN